MSPPLPAIVPLDPRGAARLPKVGQSPLLYPEYGVVSAFADAGVDVAAAAPPISSKAPSPPANAVIGQVTPPSVRLDKAAEAARRAGDAQLASYLEALQQSDKFYSSFMLPGAPAQTSRRRTTIPAGALRQIIDMNLAEELPGTSPPPSFVSKLKLVPKRAAESHLWRVILAACEVNDASRPPPRAPIPSLREVVDQVLVRPWAVVADLRSWFFQIPLPSGVCRDVFAFQVRGRTYAFTRLPMGWTWAPYLATALAQAIWRNGAPGAGYCTVWVDDSIISAASRDEAESHLAGVRAECDRVGAIIKHASIGQQFTYVGMDFELDNQRARLTSDFVHGMDVAVRAALAPGATLHAAWSAAGAAIWSCYAMRWPYAPFSSLLADIADAHGRDPNPDGLFDMSSSNAARLQAIARHVGSRPWYTRLSTPCLSPPVVVAADASPIGIGVVVHAATEHAIPHPADTPQSHVIQQRAEAVAVCAALADVSPSQAPPGSTVTVLTDNSGVAWRLARWSATPALQDAVAWVWKYAAERQWRLVVGLVPGDRMPADRPSRSLVPYFVISPQDLSALARSAFYPPGAGSVVPTALPFV